MESHTASGTILNWSKELEFRAAGKMKAGDLCLVAKLTRSDMMAAERLFKS